MLLITNHVKSSGIEKYEHIILQYRAIHQLCCPFYWIWLPSFDSYLLVSDLGEWQEKEVGVGTLVVILLCRVVQLLNISSDI